MNTKAIWSSDSDEWETPQEFYDMLNDEFCFDLDPCANDTNNKTEQYFSIDDDGLSKNWGGHRVFCNPPYSQIGKWVKKCYEEAHKPGTIVVLLIPSRTDTRYFHDYILHRSEVRFVKGRLKFGDSKNAAPFPSMVVIFRGAGM